MLNVGEETGEAWISENTNVCGREFLSSGSNRSLDLFHRASSVVAFL